MNEMWKIYVFKVFIYLVLIPPIVLVPALYFRYFTKSNT